MRDQRHDFRDALAAHAEAFGVRLGEAQERRLADYFEMLGRWNERLHLVAPCAPAEFAVRHVLESLFALEHIPAGSSLADVGSGGGLPAVPCLVARGDLRATLYEASAKKTVFLREAAGALGLKDVARIINARFEETTPPQVNAVTCRALEHFAEMLPRLVEWSPKGARLLLFGGAALREAIEREGLSFTPVHIPESERRFLFVVGQNRLR
ncbi:MAG: 16S rRNA (guanine(527)-N(7))-methyltransferase RsmG [Acidobacteria bacterium]|nr:16S rRNA (guanine(527)-N(7))-methyltransferase RsmG [Acidobacteriota bacterium]MCA1642857.1 16S rRNA (guanine(527)-N(7))-methyltransferase RsmG [Acidobacteriota bacterium]